MYTTAHHKIRHQCFEAFWYTHHLAFFFMIALYTHATGCFVRDTVDPDYISTFPFYSTDHCLGYFSWRFIIWPGILYFGERVWREIRARRATRLSKVLVHPSGMFSVVSHGLVDRAHSYRCYGVTNNQTKLQVRPRSMALHPGSRCLRVSMASRKSIVLFFTALVYVFFLHFSLQSPPRRRTPIFLSTSARLGIGPKHSESVLEQDRQSLPLSPQLQ